MSILDNTRLFDLDNIPQKVKEILFMTQTRQPDPRDNPDTTQSTQNTQQDRPQDDPRQPSNQDAGGTELAVVDTGQKVAERPKSTNPYVYDQDELDLWGDNYSMDTSIARAWSRMKRAGHYLGSPTAGENVSEDTTVQPFQYAFAIMNNKNNDNQDVFFHDGRGMIGTERGL